MERTAEVRAALQRERSIFDGHPNVKVMGPVNDIEVVMEQGQLHIRVWKWPDRDATINIAATGSMDSDTARSLAFWLQTAIECAERLDGRR